MDTDAALSAFAALSQDTRLQTYRLLVSAMPDGLLAGEIAATLDVRANTLSANLTVLLNAGLVVKTREGRGIRYRADMAGMAAVLSFLMEDCCGGHPDLCRAAIADIAPEPTRATQQAEQAHNTT